VRTQTLSNDLPPPTHRALPRPHRRRINFQPPPPHHARPPQAQLAIGESRPSAPCARSEVDGGQGNNQKRWRVSRARAAARLESGERCGRRRSGKTIAAAADSGTSLPWQQKPGALVARPPRHKPTQKQRGGEMAASEEQGELNDCPAQGGERLYLPTSPSWPVPVAVPPTRRSSRRIRGGAGANCSRRPLCRTAGTMNAAAERATHSTGRPVMPLRTLCRQLPHIAVDARTSGPPPPAGRWVPRHNDVGRGGDEHASTTRNGSACGRNKWVAGGCSRRKNREKGRRTGQTGRGNATAPQGRTQRWGPRHGKCQLLLNPQPPPSPTPPAMTARPVVATAVHPPPTGRPPPAGRSRVCRWRVGPRAGSAGGSAGNGPASRTALVVLVPSAPAPHATGPRTASAFPKTPRTCEESKIVFTL